MTFPASLMAPSLPGVALLCLGLALPAPSLAQSLKSQLAILARTSAFHVDGLERLEHESAKSVHGDTREQLSELLTDYNYLLIQGSDGRIERVSITSRKDPDAKPRFSPVVATTRYGAHHQVEAILTGPHGETATVALLVDTGATTLVLPASMIESLGFSKESLRTAMSQTASDTVPIRIGTLQSVQVGQAFAENVEVSFFPDSRLKNAKLLGMSFLNRYRFSLDDERNELSLLAK